jgi:LysM repeat protein
VAAAFALAGAPAAGASVVSAPAAKALAHHTTAAARPLAAHVVSVTRPAAKHAAPAPATYTVVSGDTLSAIAQHFYGSSDYWPVVYWANHSQIQYADEIQVGQVLAVPVKPATIPAAPTVLAPAPVQPAPVQAPVSQPAPVEPAPVQPAPVQSAPVQSAPVQSAPVQSAPVQSAPVQSAPADTSVSTAGDSAFQSCVINAESGGNSQVMNSSGHYGLYQFSASTWAEYGGNPADFGNASVAEQNQVFNNAIAAGGESNWAPYDGC